MNKILFTEPNRIATVEERKTNTRRLVNSRTGFFNVESEKGIVTDVWQTNANGWLGDQLIPVKPRYKVGETVYIAEPYRILSCNGDADENILDDIILEYSDRERIRYNPIIYDPNNWIEKRNKEMLKSKSGFCNKMFIPEWAARTFIKITDVRCERLQDISDEDCFKEGIYDDGTGYVYEHNGIAYSTPREAYAAEIDMINGKGTWDSNPFVWSYYYELVKSIMNER